MRVQTQTGGSGVCVLENMFSIAVETEVVSAYIHERHMSVHKPFICCEGCGVILVMLVNCSMNNLAS